MNLLKRERDSIESRLFEETQHLESTNETEAKQECVHIEINPIILLSNIK